MSENSLEQWSASERREFLGSLDDEQVLALRDLLLLAGLADDMLSIQERLELIEVLADAPALDGGLDFNTSELIDHIDDLYARHEDSGDALVDELLEELGDDTVRVRAFRLALHLMASHGVVGEEEKFARHLAEVIGIDDEMVEAALADARSLGEEE